jgi:tetratricopeptide (TPR) repeat protein
MHDSRTIHRRRTVSRSLACLALAAFAIPSARAYEFRPTESEWATWPAYCKARYATTRIGRGGGYGGAMSEAEIQKWQQATGGGWLYLHHTCAGIVHLQRAKLAPTDTERQFALNKAINEHRLSLEHTPAADPFYAEILVQMGLTYREARNYGAAIEQFDKAIAGHPKTGGAYVGKAMVLRDQGKLDAALATLKAGETATEGKSSEVHHFTAVLLMQQKRYEEAREHARQAYALGYPLPGLRNNLARAGYPL